MKARICRRAAPVLAALVVTGGLTAVTVPAAAAAPVASTPVASTPAVPAVRLPQLTVDPAAAKRTAAGGTGVLRFPIRLLRSASTTVTVRYATSDSTAHAGTDYTAATGTATIAAGATTTSVAVVVAAGAVAKSRQMRLVLSRPSGARLENDNALGTILADTATMPQVNIGDAADYRRLAVAGKVVFPVLLSGAATSAVSLHCETGVGTATGYQHLTKDIVIPAGSTRAAVTVGLSAEYLRTGSNFPLTCSNAVGAQLGRATATGSILPGVMPVLGVGIRDTYVVADPATQIAQIPLYEFGAAAGQYPVAVTYRYNTPKGGTRSASIPAGSTSTTIPIPVNTSTWCNGDDLDNPCYIELLKVQVGDDIGRTHSTAGLVGAHGSAKVTVVPDRAQASHLVVQPFDTAVEVGDTYRVPARLTPPASGATYTWTTEDGTAVAGRDYVPASGTYTADGSPGPVIDVLPASRPPGALSFTVRFTPVAPASQLPGFDDAATVVIDPIDTFRPTGTVRESSGMPLPAGLQVFFDTYPTPTQVPVNASGNFALAGFPPLAATGHVVVPAGWTGNQTFSIPTGAGPGHVDLTVTAPG